MQFEFVLTVASNKLYSPGECLSQNPGHHGGSTISGEVIAKKTKAAVKSLSYSDVLHLSLRSLGHPQAFKKDSERQRLCRVYCRFSCEKKPLISST